MIFDNVTKHLLEGLHYRGLLPILYVTHSPQEAFAVGEQVVVLQSGRILAQGTPQEVLSKPRHETIAQIVGFENVFDAKVRSVDEALGTMICQ